MNIAGSAGGITMGRDIAAAGAELRTGGVAEDTGAVIAPPWGLGTPVAGGISCCLPWGTSSLCHSSPWRGNRGLPCRGRPLSRRRHIKHLFQLEVTPKLPIEISTLEEPHQLQMLSCVLEHKSPALARHFHQGIT